MKDNKLERRRHQALMFGRQFLKGDASIFDQALGADAVVAAAISTQAAGCRERIYGPLDTLRLFVGQVLSADRARQDVVGRRLSERIAQGQSESALGTGAYCDKTMPKQWGQTPFYSLVYGRTFDRPCAIGYMQES